MRLGITGGLGCGKSTVARLFEQKGFRRLDSDLVVRDQVLTDSGVIAAVEERFGSSVLTVEAGARRIDRAELGRRVFAHDPDREWLEALVHPQVYAAWTAAFAAEPAARWVVEVPLLHEKGLENWFDFTVCVACAPAQQLARLEQRGLPRGLAGQRISKQLPLARKIELSDFVLWNEGSSRFLEAQVDHLADTLPAC